MAALIPTRPSGFDCSGMDERELDCLTYSVLMGCANEDAFKLFFSQYTADKGGKRLNPQGKKLCEQTFSYARNREYLDAYRREIKEYLSIKGKEEPSVDVGDKRKAEAMQSLFDHAMRLVESKTSIDPDTLKVVAEIFRKVGLLKDEEEVQEKARRYLPIRCISECQYRLFCEQGIKNGEIENECEHCKALKIAKEHGYRYDPTKNLEIPIKEN